MADASDAASAGTPAVSVRLPGLLARFTDGEERVTVRAGTVGAVVDALLDRYPALAPHLHDADGALRPHLQLFHGRRPVAEAAADEVPVEDGDEVVVLQAVSGG